MRAAPVDDGVSERPVVLPRIEQLELEAHRGEIVRDVRRLVEKYRAIFQWDVPDVDQVAADTLILTEVALALEVIRQDLRSE